MKIVLWMKSTVPHVEFTAASVVKQAVSCIVDISLQFPSNCIVRAGVAIVIAQSLILCIPTHLNRSS